ncbi:hypothetical protein SO802_020240 [Lithocarpus litseifolius]|uniref:Uncharacterized protein n=1 Tax=Lithocarpus litseifolius TaxID=425828 RepID=A0AAW2CFE6_9ROSI
MSRPWVGVASFHDASTPLSLRSTTSSFGSIALSPTMTLRLLLFLCQLSPIPPTSLATRSQTSSGSFSVESSSPFSSLPNSLTLRDPLRLLLPPPLCCSSKTLMPNTAKSVVVALLTIPRPSWRPLQENQVFENGLGAVPSTFCHPFPDVNSAQRL